MVQSWMNSDGLYKKYGTDAATVNNCGEYVTTGPQRMIEVTISDLTALGSSAAPTIVSDQTFFPKMRIEKVEIINTTAATSGGSATLSIGLIRTDRTTEIDYDGFVAQAALSTFNTAGETNSMTVGSTAAGALLGTTTTNPGYIVAYYGTAVFTAGAVKVRIYYSA